MPRPAEYAEAGIRHYRLVEVDPPATLTGHVLVDGVYEEVAHGSGVLSPGGPVPLTVDLGPPLGRR